MIGWVWKPSQALIPHLTLSLPPSLQAVPLHRVGGKGRDDGLNSSPSVSSHPSSTQTRQFYVSIQPPVGELMAPVFMSENEFKKEQGECSLGVGREGSIEADSRTPSLNGRENGGVLHLDQGSANFFCNGPKINVLGFENHVISVAVTTRLWLLKHINIHRQYVNE